MPALTANLLALSCMIVKFWDIIHLRTYSFGNHNGKILDYVTKVSTLLFILLVKV